MSFRLFLDPFDTFIIRDGRPFNQDDAGRAVAASRFPPPLDTLYGAARVALARSHHWDGTGDWASTVPKDQFGGWDNPGSLGIAGPFFTVGEETLLPIPAHVYARVDKQARKVTDITPLKPSNDAFETDVAGLRLLAMPPPDDRFRDEPLAGRFARSEAVRKLLDGGKVSFDELGPPQVDASSPGHGSLLPNTPVQLPGWGVSDLVATEPRVGIARNSETRQVADGQLYASAPRRLRRGIGLFVEVDGVECGAAGMPVAVSFGGEGRFAHPRHSSEGSSILRDQTVKATRFLIYLATPLMLGEAKGKANLWERISGFPGRVCAAAVTGISTQAGFVRKGERSRRTLGASRHVLPAGSVLFVECDPAGLKDRLGLADAKHMGYGRYLMGAWNDE